MIKKIAEHLKKSGSVAIFVHRNPDWDCIGSAFALRNALRSINIKADILTDEPLSKHLNFMEKDVVVYSEDKTMPPYECFCALDVADSDRMGLWGKFFEKNPNTVCIDHHRTDGTCAALSHTESARSSTGELIYELLSAGGFEITKEIASYLYCAISSDTGSFKYASVNVRTYEILIELTKAGIDSAYLSSMLYERNSLEALLLKAEAINSLRFYADGKIATARVTDEMLKKCGAARNDADSLAQIPRSIDGVFVSALLKETADNGVRVSLRADGEYDVEKVARVFGGGGHRRASGCTFENTNIDEAERRLVQEAEKLF